MPQFTRIQHTSLMFNVELGCCSRATAIVLEVSVPDAHIDASLDPLMLDGDEVLDVRIAKELADAGAFATMAVVTTATAVVLPYEQRKKLFSRCVSECVKSLHALSCAEQNLIDSEFGENLSLVIHRTQGASSSSSTSVDELEAKVLWVSWDDPVTNFGQPVFLDQQCRAKFSMHRFHPNQYFTDCEILVKDANVAQPRRGEGTSAKDARPRVPDEWLRVKKVFEIALESGQLAKVRFGAKAFQDCLCCGQWGLSVCEEYPFECALCLSTFHESCCLGNVLPLCHEDKSVDSLVADSVLPHALHSALPVTIEGARRCFCAVCRTLLSGFDLIKLDDSS
jgi:hypothetical protein